MLTPALKTGLVAIGLAALLWPVNALLAAVPLAVFVLCCAAASLMPRTSFFLPVVSRGTTGRKAVALTFDDGPDPLTTPLLLEMLAKHGIKAAFFVSGREAERYPDLIRAIIAQGHEIGNHSYSHDPFLMLYSARNLAREVSAAQEALKKIGLCPLAFRPPVGLTNPKLGPVLSRLGLFCLTFSCRAFDRGNRQLDGLARKILTKVRPDDIILLHDTRPAKIDAVAVWLNELGAILRGLGDRGFNILTLHDLIGRPVMTFCGTDLCTANSEQSTVNGES